MNRTSAVVLLVVLAASPVLASTAAFQGRVVEVGDVPSNQNDTLKTFTVSITYFDYCSWGKFGKDSKIGEPITRRVRPVGTVGVLDGELTNARTIANAFRPGQWGYFYEDTWLNLRTTPEFVWGEFVRHDAEKKTFVLRLHRTHKQIHLDANPPIEKEFSYDGETSFRIEQENASPADALAEFSWIQIHDPREQILLLRTKESDYDPKEQLPVDAGKRGFANDLTRAVTLDGIDSKDPNGVIDVGATIQVTNGDGKPETVEARSVSFVLDGKLAPVRIANRAGRRAVLCYYRSERRPHKVFVESRDTAIRGEIVRVTTVKGATTVTIRNGSGETENVLVDPKALISVDGVPTPAEDAFLKSSGRSITVHPKSGRTIVAFPPAD